MVYKHLSEKRDAILTEWRDLVLESYPPDAARFFREERDPFANPVGSSVSQALDRLYDELLLGKPPEQMGLWLDPIIRIRAVQNFTPSQAVGFVLLLKTAVRRQLGEAAREPKLLQELFEFDSRIDRLALVAFDLYLQCREQVFEIRVKEAKAGREAAWRVWERGRVR